MFTKHQRMGWGVVVVTPEPHDSMDAVAVTAEPSQVFATIPNTSAAETKAESLRTSFYIKHICNSVKFCHFAMPYTFQRHRDFTLLYYLFWFYLFYWFCWFFHIHMKIFILINVINILEKHNIIYCICRGSVCVHETNYPNCILKLLTIKKKGTAHLGVEYCFCITINTLPFSMFLLLFYTYVCFKFGEYYHWIMTVSDSHIQLHIHVLIFISKTKVHFIKYYNY